MSPTPSPLAIPDHLPRRLAITLWDFSWYVRTGPGEPFEDLDAAFAQAVDRGYNTVRVCAMPFLLFRSGIDTTALRLGPLGGDYAQRVRWYQVGAETTIDAREHLLALFRAAERHGCFVILSSWEYQQSPAFALDPAWHAALQAVDPERRAEVLADAHADLIDLLVAEGLDDRVAFTELHNEVNIGYLIAGLPGGRDQAVLELRPRLERGLARFRERHPDAMCTVNYGGVPHGQMRGIPDGVDVLVVHPYVYGVLGELVDGLRLRGPLADFDAAAAAPLLLPGAPPATDWVLPAADAWKGDASIMEQGEIYLHDWADASAVDRWLYDHYGEHRLAMAQKITTWLEVAADWAASHGVPLVLGEGWVGYTPLEGTFEEGPVGAQICRDAVSSARALGAWGTVVCSNAAPHHPMWDDVDLQQGCNRLFTAPDGADERNRTT